MKTKAKLTLAISIMSAAVLAAGVTSTFAWFVTQNKATLATGTMTVDTVSSITIEVTKLGFDTDTTSATNFNTPTIAATDAGQPLGPVSSIDGIHFYAPKALNDGTAAYAAADMAEVTTKASWNKDNGYGGYMKYGIHVHAGQDSGAPRTLHYKITPTVTDTELTAAYRVALINATYTTEYVPGAAVGLYSDTAGSKDGWTYSTAIVKSTYTTTAISSVASPVAVTGVTTASTIDKYYIFSVWVEGEDANATNEKISAATLAVGLEFSLA